MRDRLLEALAGKKTAADKLFALLEVGRNAFRDEALRGGCPIMNLAGESDDGGAALRELARDAMARRGGLFEGVSDHGTKQGGIAAGDPRARAIWMVASIEGAVMLSNLYKDRDYMEAVVDHLRSRVENGFR